jgi:uncharacterized protein YjbJ (UPF0337 family)
MNKDQKSGTVENLKGRAKQAVGIVTGDKAEESSGASERAGGAVKKAFGDIKHGVAKKLDK